MQGIGYACAALTFLYFCAIVFMRDRIAIAIQVTKEASKALMDMPMMLFFPIIPFLVICCTTHNTWWPSYVLWAYVFVSQIVSSYTWLSPY